VILKHAKKWEHSPIIQVTSSNSPRKIMDTTNADRLEVLKQALSNAAAKRAIAENWKIKKIDAEEMHY